MLVGKVDNHSGGLTGFAINKSDFFLGSSSSPVQPKKESQFVECGFYPRSIVVIFRKKTKKKSKFHAAGGVKKLDQIDIGFSAAPADSKNIQTSGALNDVTEKKIGQTKKKKNGAILKKELPLDHQCMLKERDP